MSAPPARYGPRQSAPARRPGSPVPLAALQGLNHPVPVGFEDVLHLHRLQHQQGCPLLTGWPASTCSATTMPCMGPGCPGHGSCRDHGGADDADHRARSGCACPPGAAKEASSPRAAPDSAACVHPGTGGSDLTRVQTGSARLPEQAACPLGEGESAGLLADAHRGAKAAGGAQPKACGLLPGEASRSQVASQRVARARRAPEQAGCRWEWATGCGGASPAPLALRTGAAGAGRCAPEGRDPGLPGHRPGWQRLRCGSVRGRRAWRSWGRNRGLTSSPAVTPVSMRTLGQVSQWMGPLAGRKPAATSSA